MTIQREGAKKRGIPKVRLSKAVNKPPSGMNGYVILLYGRKGIGKSELAAQFPGPFAVSWEPGRRHLPIRMHRLGQGTDLLSATDTEIRDYYADEWLQYKGVLQSIVEDSKILTPSIDTIDRCYYASECYWLREFDCTSLEDIGKRSYDFHTQRRRDFEATHNALIACQQEKGGAVVFVSHDRTKDTTSLVDNTAYEIVQPTATGKTIEYLQAVADFFLCYEFYDDQRVIFVRGTDRVNAACGPTGCFLDKKTKEPLTVLAVGTSAEAVYKDLKDAYANKREEFVPEYAKPDPNIEDIVLS